MFLSDNTLKNIKSIVQNAAEGYGADLVHIFVHTYPRDSTISTEKVKQEVESSIPSANLGGVIVRRSDIDITEHIRSWCVE